MTKIKDITGIKYNHLLAIKFEYIKNRYSYWLFKCDCGVNKIIRKDCVLAGTTVSCGCVQKQNRLKHGLSKTNEYKSWIGLKERCLNKNRKNYGAKGIKVCDRWLNSFENFYNDMGVKPTPNHSIDRIDSSGDYEPSNCRWATPKGQARNIKTNKILTYKNKKECLSKWCEILDLNYKRTHSRINSLNWSVEEAFEKPARKGNWRNQHQC